MWSMCIGGGNRDRSEEISGAITNYKRQTASNDTIISAVPHGSQDSHIEPVRRNVRRRYSRLRIYAPHNRLQKAARSHRA